MLSLNKKILKHYIAFIFICLFVYKTKAQNISDVIQFSGLVLTSDSIQALPYATIYIKNRNLGAISNFNGYFSIVVEPGDTIDFSYVGFTKKRYIVPDTLLTNRYSIVQLMTQDTIYLAETVIYPWPSRDQFKEAFLNTYIPDDDLERAKKNLAREKLKALGKKIPADGNENADIYLRQQAAKFYTYGQFPSIQLLNPMAWAKFFEAWKNGDFKKKKD